jgi:hypothetical protein
MEVDNAVKANEETIAEEIHAEATVVAPEKEKTNASNSERPLNANETSESFAKAEGLNSSSIASEGAASVSQRKISNALKVQCKDDSLVELLHCDLHFLMARNERNISLLTCV